MTDIEEYISSMRLMGVEVEIDITENNDGTCVLLKKVQDSVVTFKIPDFITMIAIGCFAYSTKLKRVIAGESLIYISASAFEGCSSLESVELNNVINYIGYRAFEKCIRLKKIRIPSTVETICNYSFMGCEALEEVELSEGLLKIECDAFDKCSKLTKLNIPKSVTSVEEDIIGRTALACERNMNNKEIYIDGWCLGYTLEFRNNINTEIVIEEGTEKLACSAFFENYNLEKVVLPNSITYMGEDVFELCVKLKSINIYTKLRHINENMFKDCCELDNITIPSNIVRVKTGAFYGCVGLKSLTFSEGLNAIAIDAFKMCEGLVNVKLPKGLTIIEDYAFADCLKLKSIYIPTSVNDIGKGVFNNIGNDLVIHCEKNSKASDYALERKIKVRWVKEGEA